MVNGLCLCDCPLGEYIPLCLKVFFFIKDFNGGNKREVTVLFKGSGIGKVIDISMLFRKAVIDFIELFLSFLYLIIGIVLFLLVDNIFKGSIQFKIVLNLLLILIRYLLLYKKGIFSVIHFVINDSI